jgi:hypothetical protein
MTMTTSTFDMGNAIAMDVTTFGMRNSNRRRATSRVSPKQPQAPPPASALLYAAATLVPAALCTDNSICMYACRLMIP